MRGIKYDNTRWGRDNIHMVITSDGRIRGGRGEVRKKGHHMDVGDNNDTTKKVVPIHLHLRQKLLQQ